MGAGLEVEQSFVFFCKVIKKKIERTFAKNFARNYEKIILGTSDA